jgi:hypothetical protein
VDGFVRKYKKESILLEDEKMTKSFNQLVADIVKNIEIQKDLDEYNSESKWYQYIQIRKKPRNFKLKVQQ